MTNKLILFCGLAAAVCYVAHLAGPLRLVDDGPLFLTGAMDLAAGRGYHDDHMPRGYSQALATVALLGFNSVPGIVGLNLICIGVGLFLAAGVLRSEFPLSDRQAALCAGLCCFSWTWVYLAPVPMSEAVFFLLECAALAALSEARRASRQRAIVLIAAAAALSLAAYFVRTIGAALFAAVAAAVLERAIARGLISWKTARRSLVAGCVAMFAMGFVGKQWLATPWYANAWQESPAEVINTVGWRIGEIGEIVQNVAVDAFPSTSPTLPIESTPFRTLLTLELHVTSLVVGLAAILLAAIGVRRCRRFSHVEAFVGAYIGILLIWPYTAVRFWTPVLPFLFGYLLVGLLALSLRLPKVARLVPAYCALFIVCGFVSLGHSLGDSYIDPARHWRGSRAWLTHHHGWLVAYEYFSGGSPNAGAHQ